LSNAVDKYVGARVRMRRKMLSKSQSNLADALGLTFQQVQKYENGMNRISSSRMFQISNFLSVPPEFFYEGAARIEPFAAGSTLAVDPASVQEFVSTRDGLDLARAFPAIKDKGIRRRIVALVCDLADRDDQPGANMHPKRKPKRTHARH
jgi:transcriptional regulator with XRE-family HTH domain